MIFLSFTYKFQGEAQAALQNVAGGFVACVEKATRGPDRNLTESTQLLFFPPVAASFLPCTMTPSGLSLL